MQLTLDIRGFSTAIVPDQEYADARSSTIMNAGYITWANTLKNRST